MLDSSPSGNGDIGSALKILPNVQFDNAQNRSTSPGEIDPANISISGGLFFQNNFQLDGFNMNNDLTSNIGGSDNGVNGTGSKSARSQAFSIDTSLLDSIKVQDSNISAAYGGFTGGVVEANIRKPRKGFHGNLSYQFTQGNANGFSLTHYHIDPEAEQNFLNSTSEYYHPKFTKHLARASLEGHLTENFGILAAFSTTQSFIPTFAASPSYVGSNAGEKKIQKRQSHNFYLKTHINPTENLTIEANFGYMPQYNSYYWSGGAPNADYVVESGGFQAGVKAIYQTPLGLSTTSFGYSDSQSARSADSRYTYYANWFASESVNWTRSNANAAQIYTAANYGNTKQDSATATLKSDFLFDPVPLWQTTHNFLVGIELTYQNAQRVRLSPYVQFANDNNMPVPSTQLCPTTPDNLGFFACMNGKPTYNPATTPRSSTSTQTYQQYAEASSNPQVANQHKDANSWANGYDTAVAQYYNVITQFYGPNNININNFAYGAFIEDDMRLELKGGDINARLGLRLDGDSYMDKHTLAPRFSLSYVSPAEQKWQSTITLGANRYYGRNLFSYRFLDFAATRRSFQRDCASCDWVEIPLDTSVNPAWTSGVKFSQLKIPYSDELMIGITQNVSAFSISAKYIFRNGRDEIMRVSRSALNLPTQSGYSSSYSVWSNEGKSESQVIAIMIQNYRPIETFGIQHHYLFGFDYTQSKRTYNAYANDYDDEYIRDDIIIYDGKPIRFRDRPVDNFVRPWTMRLSTTHSFHIGRTKWLLNNLFSYRSAYERMVTLTTSTSNATYKQWLALYPNMKGVYVKRQFKGAFSWDMRIGFELNLPKAQVLYMNLDIFNVLNAHNETTISSSNGNTSYGIASSSMTYAVYDVGRQFWVQVGYRF